MPAQEPLFDMDLPTESDVWVYLIGVPSRPVAKIGIAQDTAKRLASIQTSHHERLSVLWRTRGSRLLEKQLHDYFGDIRLEGEWFDFGGEDPVEALRRAALEVGSGSGETAPFSEPPNEDADIEAPRQGIEYSLYPADDDPDRDDPLYAPFHKAGCRYFTPTESASWGHPADSDAVWVRCGMRAAYHF